MIEHMPDKHCAVEVRWRRIGELARVLFDPIKQFRDRTGRLIECGSVIGDSKLRPRPGHLAPCDGNAEIIRYGWIVPVYQSIVGQGFGIAAPHKIALPHCSEVFAVDPDQVH